MCSTLKEKITNLAWHQNDLASESCENIDSSNIWIPEVHLGVSADIATVLAYLGQNPILAGRGAINTKFNKKFPQVNKLVRTTTQISPTIASYGRYFKIDESDIKSNYEFYKDNQEFKSVDFVICSFYSSLCETFIPLNKTLIFNAAHRYNLGKCNSTRWTNLNRNYYMLNSKSKLIVASMSKYDREYQYHFTGLHGFRLYAFSGYYTKNVSYMPSKSDILVGPSNYLNPNAVQYLSELNNYSRVNNQTLKFIWIKDAYPSMYTFEQLATHKAVVVFPYAVMTYSIVEFYALKIPIFVPSTKMWTALEDRSIRYTSYCGNVSDISPFNQTTHKFSPNEEQHDSFDYWMKYADFYQWPHVIVFDSWEDLITKLNTLDLHKISAAMERFNYVKEADLLDQWCKVLRLKDKSASIPRSYETALSYFNVSFF